jgi:hypothetical protein
MAAADGASGAVVPVAAAPAPAAPASDSPTAVWTVPLEEKFINIWGEEFVRIKQGNFRPHNWTFVTEQINKEVPDGEPQFSIKQCQGKMDSLKKRFIKELKKKTSTGSVNSSWTHFHILAPYLKKLAKVAGIPGAIDSGLVKVPSPAEFEEDNVEGAEEDEYVVENAGAEPDPVEQPTAEEQTEEAPASADSTKTQATTKTPSEEAADKAKRKSTESSTAEGQDCQEISPLHKFESKPGVNGQPNGKSKKFKSSPGAALARSIDNFTKVYANMATKALEVEERIAKDKADTNLQMLDIKLKYQTELEKLRRSMQDP